MYYSLLLLLPLAAANTPLTDALVQSTMHTTHGFDLAWASRPKWHFGLPSPNTPPCYPSAALINGQQHGTEPDVWPRAGSGCADPGPRGKGRPFPTYFTTAFCGADEIRVAYSLYTSHDGFRMGGAATGHMHDWERAIVVWTRAGGLWTRTQLLLSSHSGYSQHAWDAAEDTPRVFVGWAKHALFSGALTAWRDLPSQGCGREFRAGDWWYVPEKDDLVCGGEECLEGSAMMAFQWGSADSGPWTLKGRVCDAVQGGACVLVDGVVPPLATETVVSGRKGTGV